MKKNWRAEYESKRMTSDEAVKIVRDGDRIYIGTAASVAYELDAALARRANELNDITLMYSHCFKPLATAKVEHFKVITYFLSAAERTLVNTPRFDYTSFHLSQSGLWCKKVGKPTVAFLDVSLPDENGYCSLGAGGVVTSEGILESADRIILQVNKYEPYVTGRSTLIHISQADAIVEFDDPLAQGISREETDPDFLKIAELVADEIPDGACLQFGGGHVIDAIAPKLMEKNDLGIHTELMGIGMMKLIKNGNVNNKYKQIHKGETVVGFIAGNNELYEFADHNDKLYFAPLTYVNDPSVSSQNDNFISINSCLYIDLFGQVGSENINGVQYSGIGGQVDFVRGAQLSKGGKSILTCGSTFEKRDGSKGSRIVPFIPGGTPVTTSRADVHYVATEYGCVNLKELTMRERCRAIIDLAEPQFREELTAFAIKHNML